MAFVSRVKCESDKKSEKVEEEERSDNFEEDSKDETSIHKAYQQGKQPREIINKLLKS